MKLTILFGIILGIISFGKTAPSEDPQINQIAEGLKNFSYKWSEVALKNSIGKNLITSAISVEIAMAMLYFGANGNTKNEIKKSLYLPESNDKIKYVMKRITQGINETKKIDIKIANRIFTNSQINLKNEYKDITRDTFDAEAENLDFTNKPDEASKTINDWVQSKTNNYIKDFISSDDVKDNAMILVNSVYFNGKWQTPFHEVNMSPFNLNDKESKNVSTMHGHGHFMYGDLIGVDAKYVILPYEGEDDEKFSMFIIVPNEINGLKNIENNMDNIKWKEAIAGGSIKKLHIDMPKFKLESKIDIEPLLKEMGMNDVFSDKADFTGISDSQSLKVTKAIQKAFIDVNEKGTEAAAATGIQIVPTSLVIDTEPEIHVSINRPFLFSIMMNRKHSEALVFLGRCVNPNP